ncbi:hypothetical protein HDU98_007691 [Podochytrium sp. JEL0797]|nr:hypothetical protein HDU98_007691 [Podochytrium sp. JEL0797]
MARHPKKKPATPPPPTPEELDLHSEGLCDAIEATLFVEDGEALTGDEVKADALLNAILKETQAAALRHSQLCSVASVLAHAEKIRSSLDSSEKPIDQLIATLSIQTCLEGIIEALETAKWSKYHYFPELLLDVKTCFYATHPVDQLDDPSALLPMPFYYNPRFPTREMKKHLSLREKRVALLTADRESGDPHAHIDDVDVTLEKLRVYMKQIYSAIIVAEHNERPEDIKPLPLNSDNEFEPTPRFTTHLQTRHPHLQHQHQHAQQQPDPPSSPELCKPKPIMPVSPKRGRAAPDDAPEQQPTRRSRFNERSPNAERVLFDGLSPPRKKVGAVAPRSSERTRSKRVVASEEDEMEEAHDAEVVDKKGKGKAVPQSSNRGARAMLQSRGEVANQATPSDDEGDQEGDAYAEVVESASETEGEDGSEEFRVGRNAKKRVWTEAERREKIRVTAEEKAIAVKEAVGRSEELMIRKENAPKLPRPRQKWLAEELDALEAGMQEFGVEWCKIHRKYFVGHLPERDQGALKDKVANELLRRMKNGIDPGLYSLVWSDALERKLNKQLNL